MTKTSGTNQLRDAYRRLMDRVAEAAIRSGRKPQSIITMAVTKTASPDQIRMLVEMGHGDLGESRVQQLIQRVAQLEEFMSRRRTLGRATARTEEVQLPDVRWHMIGHLQRNKVKQVLPLVRLIHTIDSLRLAEEVQAIAQRADRVVDVLLQVNSSGEEGKFGVAAPAAVHLAEQIDTMMNLRVRGVMTMGPQSDDTQLIRSAFARTAEIFSDMRKAKIGGNNLTVLSMGMSNDFELAIEHGANVIRIGRALFGDAES